MAGRITASQTQLRPDPKFNDKVLSKIKPPAKKTE